jgi:hypothetical protein
MKVLIKKNGAVYIWVVDCARGEVQGEEREIETRKTN